MRVSPNSLICTMSARRLVGTVTWQSDCLNIMASAADPIECTINGQTLSSRVCTWFSHEPVTLTVPQEAHVLLLLLHPVGVLDLTGNPALFETNAELPSGPVYGELMRLYRLTQRNETDLDYAMSACILNLLQILQHSAKGGDTLPVPLASLSDHRFSLYRALYTYIDGHYADGITQADTAAVFQITPQYLARFLRENLNMTFRQLLAERREAKADAYRRYTTLSEEEITLHTSADYLPRDYHTQDMPQLPGAVDNDLSPLRIVQDQPTEVSMRPDRVYINADLSTRHHTRHYWRRLINLGYATNLQEAALASTLCKLQQDIHFEYARICRIADLITSYTVDDRTYYDFSHVFSLLDTVRHYGLIPFLDLGNKTFLIQASAWQPIAPQAPEPSRDYYARLEAMLPHLMQACINYYGQSEVDTWYFEISHNFIEDPLFRDEDYDLPQYVRTFRRIYEILRRYSSGCRIGGPGFNNWRDPGCIAELLQDYKRWSIAPDFYTAYAYPVEDAPEGGIRISSDPMLLYNRIRTYAAQVHAISPEAEIWVTEFNSNLSSRNHLNDSCYQATYILHLLHVMAPLDIHAIGYYLLSDAPLRYSDSLDFLFGGWGLLTDDDIAKPSYHAYEVLAMLGYYHVKSSDVCTITASSYGRFQVLLHHFSPLLEAHCQRNLSREDLLSESALIGSGGIHRYHVRIGNVQPGTYLVEDYQLGPGHANLFKCWQQMNYLPPLDSHMRERIAQLCDLTPQIYACKVETDGQFTFDCALHDLDVHLVIVTLCEGQGTAPMEDANE